ncbi:thioredoxin family protein [Candidatus Micrarchaeota archaeon]|nr:thioredoxin family protein [Candidatus Micrarchaeota archaeon]
MDVKGEISSFLGAPFNRYLFIALLVLGVFLVISEPQEFQQESGAELTVHFFYSPTCPHCAAQEPFNQELAAEFPQIEIVKHDVTIPEQSRLLLIMAQNFSVGASSLGTPTTFIGNRMFIGFDSPEEMGAQMHDTVEDCLDGGCTDHGITEVVTTESLTRGIDLPFLGRTDLSSLSLPLLAMVLGLLDGFNPCAMWVLVYLISLVMKLNDKTRLWLIVGTFLLASGVLYFLFMTAWLNAFLLLGYVRPVTIIVGLVALGGGILSIKEYMDTKGAMVCNVVDAKGKKKLMAQMQELIAAPLTWAVMIGMIALAFTINSVEFVCSAAIPAVFTQVLALSNLSTLEYYAYIALYDLFFMLDDLIIFASAIFVYGSVGEKYAKYCKMIGGAIMFLLGIMLLFAPQLLR